MKARLTLWLAALLAAVGCSNVDSESQKNSGLKLQASASSSGTDTVVSAQIIVGDRVTGTRVELSGGDELHATIDGQDKKLVENKDLISDIHYRTTYSGDNSGKEVNVTFKRTKEPTLAANKIAMPAAFTLVLPAANASTSRSAGLEVKWEPAVNGGNVTVSVNGSCIQAFTKSVADSGSYTIAANELKPQPKPDAGVAIDSCTADLVLSRSSTGSIDSGWGEGGSFSATQSRRVNVTTNP
jgi:hypothetical protein